MNKIKDTFIAAFNAVRNIPTQIKENRAELERGTILNPDDHPSYDE